MTQDLAPVGKSTPDVGEAMWHIWMEADDDKLRATISSDGTTLTSAIGSTVLMEDFWYHVAMVYDDTDIRLYVNGVLDANGSDNPKAYTAGIYCLDIGVSGTAGRRR